jgi:hypothetical protein
MREAVDGFVACQPVAYRTPADRPDFTCLEAFPFALDPLQLTRREMADWASPRARRRRGLHRLVLRVRGDPRPRNGAGPGKGRRDARPWSVDYTKPMSAYEYYKHEGSSRTRTSWPNRYRVASRWLPVASSRPAVALN